MSWFYTREAGDEGQVLTDEGTPSGKPITVLLRGQPIPMAVCLELVSFLADILTIAEEDKALHGDINPGDVYVDAAGSVSLSGYGPVRRSGRAPDSPPQLPASDVYGLGIVLHALLSTEPMGAVPKERDAHDDAIVDRLLAIDWSEMEGLAGRDPVIHFLCSMLAHSPAERPAPLDVANIVSEVALKMGGMPLVEWARVLGPQPSPATDAPDIEEVLAAPQNTGRVFNKTGQYSRRQTASAKGECTAFWSRDKISAMLDDGEDHVSKSAMFERRDLVTMLDSEPESVIRSPRPQGTRDYPEENPWSPDVTLTGGNAPKELQNVMAGLKETANRERVELPREQPAPSAPPIAVERPPPSPVPVPKNRVSPAPERPPASKPFPWVPVLIGVIGMGMVLGLFAVAGVAYWYIESQKPEPVEAAVPVPETAPEAVPESEPEAKPKPKSRAVTPRKSKKRSARKASRAAPEPPPSDEFEVSFRAMGVKAKLQCGDGQSGSFIGVTRRTFSGLTTCRVDVGDAKGAVQVGRAGTVNCSVVDAAVVCTGP